MNAPMNRIIKIEGIARDARLRQGDRPGWNWERLTPAECDRIAELDAKATALGGLDHLTDDEIEEGAAIAETSLGIVPRPPARWEGSKPWATT